MQPEDRSPPRPSPAAHPSLRRQVFDAPPPERRGPPQAGGASEPRALRLAGPALLIEARFREITLASRLLRCDARGAFSIGAARGADAPVNPAYVSPGLVRPASDPGPPSLLPVRHRLLEPAGDGFVLHLSPAMRAHLCRPGQQLELTPDGGTVEAPLVLPPDGYLEIPCGEVRFVISPAEPAATVPRRWLSRDWHREARYTGGVALLLLGLMLVIGAVPGDPRALSFDDLASSRRFARLTTIPPDVAEPEIDRALRWMQKPGGGGAPAAAGPAGRTGDKTARATEGRRAVKGPPAPREASQVAADIRRRTLLAVLDGPRSGEVAKVFADGPVLGGHAAEVLGHLDDRLIASAYGPGGLGTTGSGASAAGTGERMIAGGGHGTRGRFGDGSGPGSGDRYGTGVGPLATRKALTPEIIPGVSSVRGALDKEIIRRIVRRHLNEVRYCYERALPRHPALAGRMVVQFTIAASGRVLAALVQSSTLASAQVEGCVVQAVRRWEFPEPRRGGLVMVSYPFQLTPAGT